MGHDPTTRSQRSAGSATIWMGEILIITLTNLARVPEYQLLILILIVILILIGKRSAQRFGNGWPSRRSALRAG